MELTTAAISALPREHVRAFHRLVFPHRSATFFDRFEWRYRVGYDSRVEPVMAVLPDGRIVGQAAMIPVRIRVAGSVQAANWYIDFIVAPDMQRKGVGQVLTKAWMDLCDIQITHCNDQSIGVFRKVGWHEHFECYRFAYPINLAKVLRYKGLDPRLATSAAIVQPIYRLFTRTTTLRRATTLEVQPLHTVYGDLTTIVKDDADFSLVHDQAWLQWRLIDSPVADEYFHASRDDAHLIFRIVDSDGIRRANILYLSDYASETSAGALAAGLVAWAFENGIDLVWAVCNHPMLVRMFDGIFPSKLPIRFAYHAVGAARSYLERRVLSQHGMDSDVDIVYGA